MDTLHAARQRRLDRKIAKALRILRSKRGRPSLSDGPEKCNTRASNTDKLSSKS